MKGKTWSESAAIEAWEEAGVRGQLGKVSVGRYTYLKSLDNGDVAPCIVEVFAIELTTISAKFKERGARELAWVSPDEAARRVRELELEALLIEFRPNERN